MTDQEWRRRWVELAQMAKSNADSTYHSLQETAFSILGFASRVTAEEKDVILAADAALREAEARIAAQARVTDSTEFITVNGVLFVNAEKHETVVSRHFGRAEQAEAERDRLRAEVIKQMKWASFWADEFERLGGDVAATAQGGQG